MLKELDIALQFQPYGNGEHIIFEVIVTIHGVLNVQITSVILQP